MIFLAVNYDANKLLAHELGVKVLPYFLLYRSSRGKIAGFSASLSKIQMLRWATGVIWREMRRVWYPIVPLSPFSYISISCTIPGTRSSTTQTRLARLTTVSD